MSLPCCFSRVRCSCTCDARRPPRASVRDAPQPTAPRPQPTSRAPAPGRGLARPERAGRAVPSSGGAGGAHWLSRTLPTAVFGLLAMDQDGIPSTPRGSLRQFLEQLSGAGKAIGVLTSGGDAQGAHSLPGLGRRGAPMGRNGGTREKEWGRREGCGSSRAPRNRRGTFSGRSGPYNPPVTEGRGREEYGSRILYPEDQFSTSTFVFKIETYDGVAWTALTQVVGRGRTPLRSWVTARPPPMPRPFSRPTW